MNPSAVVRGDGRRAIYSRCGDGTKFRDYLLSVGVESAEPLQIPRGSMVTTDLAPLARFLPPRGIDLRALAAAAPFSVLPEVMAKL